MNTPRTDELVDQQGNERILPNDHNATGWSSLDTNKFIDFARQLEIETIQLQQRIEELEKEQDEIRQALDAGPNCKTIEAAIGNRIALEDMGNTCQQLRQSNAALELRVGVLREALTKAELEISVSYIDWSRFNRSSPDYDKDYKPEFPPFVYELRKAIRSQPSELYEKAVAYVSMMPHLFPKCSRHATGDHCACGKKELITLLGKDHDE